LNLQLFMPYFCPVDQATHGPREGNVPPAKLIFRWSSDPFAQDADNGQHMKEVVMATPNSAVRSIPANPNLEFDRKQAKVLLDAAQRGDADAIRRFNVSHPRFGAVSDPSLLGKAVGLHDAQLVVAREYGFASWPRWKQFVETRRLDVSQRAAELVKAACSNDVRKARVMLDAEPSLARHDLFTAIACGEADAVAQYLSRDPSLAKSNGGPLRHEPILYACFSRFMRADPIRADGIVRAAKLLLDAGADPNSHSWADSEKEQWLQSALYGSAGIANHAELTNLLLDAGAVVDPRDKEVLYHGSEFPDLTCLQMILSRGEPPIELVRHTLGRVLDFEYPDHVAALLAAGADPNQRTDWAGVRTYLHHAVYLGRSVAIVKMLIDAGGDVNVVDDRGVSILRSALRSGDSAVVALLRSCGAREDGVTSDDAKLGDPITLCIAASRDDIATIDRLLDAGALIDGPGSADRTPPLHWAAWRGRLRAVRRLVERGADIHWENSYGGAALGTAIHGSANCFDINGGPGMRTPEEAVAGDYPAIIEYLISRGAKLPRKIYGGSEAVQELLRRHGVPDAE
jgi:ankyrin repeat protein